MQKETNVFIFKSINYVTKSDISFSIFFLFLHFLHRFKASFKVEVKLINEKHSQVNLW